MENMKEYFQYLAQHCLLRIFAQYLTLPNPKIFWVMHKLILESKCFHLIDIFEFDLKKYLI